MARFASFRCLCVSSCGERAWDQPVELLACVLEIHTSHSAGIDFDRVEMPMPTVKITVRQPAVAMGHSR